MINNDNSKLVYSTDGDSLCQTCHKRLDKCACRQKKYDAAIPGNGKIRLSYDTKGRKGKGMTLLSGLALNQEELLELLKELKRKFGTGGTLKDGVIELQGDFREQTAQLLKNSGLSE